MGITLNVIVMIIRFVVVFLIDAKRIDNETLPPYSITVDKKYLPIINDRKKVIKDNGKIIEYCKWFDF